MSITASGGGERYGPLLRWLGLSLVSMTQPEFDSWSSKERPRISSSWSLLSAPDTGPPLPYVPRHSATIGPHLHAAHGLTQGG